MIYRLTLIEYADIFDLMKSTIKYKTNCIFTIGNVALLTESSLCVAIPDDPKPAYTVRNQIHYIYVQA